MYKSLTLIDIYVKIYKIEGDYTSIFSIIPFDFVPKPASLRNIVSVC